MSYLRMTITRKHEKKFCIKIMFLLFMIAHKIGNTKKCLSFYRKCA